MTGLVEVPCCDDGTDGRASTMCAVAARAAKPRLKSDGMIYRDAEPTPVTAMNKQVQIYILLYKLGSVTYCRSDQSTGRPRVNARKNILQPMRNMSEAICPSATVNTI